MVSCDEIIRATRDALIKASTTFRPDQMSAYRKAYQEETNPQSKWVLQQIIKNAEIAAEKKLPLCDDTGIPHVVVEIGKEIYLNGDLLTAIEKGVAIGLRELPGRPMAVKGEGLDLLGQTMGMYSEPDRLAMAPPLVKYTDKNHLKITVLMLGGGPEIRGRTLRVFHRHKGENVIEEVITWITEEVGKLGCTPTVPFIGIGRTQYEASSMLIEAMSEADFTKQSALENMITARINESKVGPMALGGKYTALATFIKIGPQRASGVRVVSLRPGCCFDPRMASVVLDD